MRLTNKTAIITGSASGFGKGIAKKFTELMVEGVYKQ